jgi:hypothetical protein
MSDEAVRKTDFATPSGLYEFVSAPFGLTSVPGAFQRFMQFVLAEHIEAGYCVGYCDDIAIFSQSDDPLVLLQHLEAVLASLREHQLLAKGSKCEFMRREAEFLGFTSVRIYRLLQRCHRRLQSCSKEAKVDDSDWHGPWNAIMRLHSSRRC